MADEEEVQMEAPAEAEDVVDDAADDVADEEDADADADMEEGAEEEDDDDDDDDGEPTKTAKAKATKKDKQKGVVKDKGATKQEKMQVSARAGLVFPVARIGKALKRGGYANRLAQGGAVYLTAVVEYITAEILELAGNTAKAHKKNRIQPRHIQLAVRNDEELSRYLNNVVISGGGVLPNIHNVLLPKKAGAAKESATAAYSQEY